MNYLMKAIFTLPMLLIPQMLWACAVCVTGQDGFSEMLQITTLMLLFLPPVLLGSIGFYFYRGHKKSLEATPNIEK